MSFRTPHSALRIRPAFTLIELLVATVAGSILLAALGSTMYIARMVAYSPLHAQKLLDGTTTTFGLLDEIKHAVYVVDYGATHIEFVTHDRDGDGVEDTIQYRWSGSAGDPLTRTFNRGASVAVIDDIHQFQLGYTIEEISEELEVRESASEAPLAPQYVSSTNFEIQQFIHLSQSVDLSGLPASAESWTLKRIVFESSQVNSTDGQMAVQLRYATSDGTPTSEVVWQFIVPESSLSGGASWYTLTPPLPVTGLSPRRDYCIVFQWLAGAEAARIRLSDSNVGAYRTGDDGATWSAVGKWAQVVVVAEPVSADTPLTIDQDRLRDVRISLQQGDNSQARIDTAVSLVNAPTMVEKAWRAEFDSDPTTQDINGDGDGDFDYSGGAFDMSSVVDGVWQASGSLRVEHTPSITTPVLIDVCGQSLGTGGRGLLAQAKLRLAANVHADVYLSLVREADGTQTARLLAYDGGTTHLLTTVPELPAKLLRARLVVDPTRRLASLSVEGVDYPVVSIPVVNTNEAVNSFIVTEDVSNAEFDYASIQITKTP